MLVLGVVGKFCTCAATTAVWLGNHGFFSFKTENGSDTGYQSKRFSKPWRRSDWMDIEGSRWRRPDLSTNRSHSISDQRFGLIIGVYSHSTNKPCYQDGVVVKVMQPAVVVQIARRSRSWMFPRDWYRKQRFRGEQDRRVRDETNEIVSYEKEKCKDSRSVAKMQRSARRLVAWWNE